jgi:haloacetate dehalogenase
MQHLGFDRFAIAGHDRGSYTAFRTGMDHPSAVTHLIVLDGVPILEALERCDARFAAAWWHWFFFAQPEKPERAINADPDAWYGGTAEQMGLEAYADYRAAVHDPRVIHGMIEDYRSGLTIDRLHDAEDREAGRRVECSTMVLWSLRDDLGQLYGDVLEIWRPWTAARLQGKGLDCGHHMAEEHRMRSRRKSCNSWNPARLYPRWHVSRHRHWQPCFLLRPQCEPTRDPELRLLAQSSRSAPRHQDGRSWDGLVVEGGL